MHHTHFRRAYQEVCRRERRRGLRLNTATLIELTIHTTQPPDFGVAYDTAIMMLGRLRREKPAREGETRPRRLFWIEMLDRVERLMAPPRNLRLGEAVLKVLAYQRPSRWYISTTTAMRIINNDTD